MKRALLWLVLAVFVALGASASAAEHEFAWIEGEDIASTTYELNRGGWGNPQYLSEENWAHLTQDDAEKVPEEGVVITYEFSLDSSGEHEVWARLGYWRLWYPFEWRIDEGSWADAPNDNYPMLGAMHIQRFHKLVWTRLAVRNLDAGDHTLTLRMEKPEGEKPRFLWAADAFCIYKGRWSPNGKYKPGEEWRAERDLKAEEYAFQLAGNPGTGERVEMDLSGDWQVARYDGPDEIENRLGPIQDAPDASELYWSSIEVPGDRNELRPDLQDAHRFFYRTRVYVPEDHEGHSFYLEVPMQNMIATVFVNGERCGWTKAPYAKWTADLTDAVRPGRENEVWIGIKDCFYGVSPELTKNKTVREGWIRPLRSREGYLTNILDMPIALMWHCGLLDRPLFVSAGTAYTADVFPQTSVKNGELKLQITLKNPTDGAIEVEMTNEVVPWKGSKVEKELPARRVRVPANGEKMVEIAEKWDDPKLWWPDDPQLYNVVTTLRGGGRALDVKKTRFGFREWDWSGTRFKLNGITWKLWQSSFRSDGPTARERLEGMREANVDMQRWRVGLGGLTRWGGLNYRQWLDFCDENGIIVRTTSPFEGMFVNYKLNPDQNPGIWENAEHMIRHWAKGLRNHPSIGFWSLQNEIVLINLRNAEQGGPLMDRISEAVMEVDGTRPTMNDGAGATGNLPVTGIHYPTVKQVRHYPEEAYTWEESRKNPHGRRAILDMSLPVFVGEGYYTGGKSIGWFASVGGETCFRGIAHCERARMLFAQILCEGMRWQGIAAADFLTGPGFYQNSFKPIAVFCRQWDWTHGSGDTVERRMKVFNMTRHDGAITARWELEFDGQTVDEGSRKFNLDAGTAEEFDISLRMPKTDSRIEGTLTLSCERDGEEVFQEQKDVSVINPDEAEMPDVEQGEIAVMDPEGLVQARLKARGLPFVEVDGPDAVPAGSRLLIVGADAVEQGAAKKAVWRDLAADGKRLLVLDQKHPLLGNAVEGDFKSTDYTGRIAFIESVTHDIFRGIEQKDLFCRSDDHVVYRNAYEKPTEGARSLVQCDSELAYSAMLESQVEDGLMLLCQAAVGSKLATDPVAQRLFDNMVGYALDYERVVNPVAVVAPADHPKVEFLEDLKLAFRRTDDPMEAIRGGLGKIVVVDATEANLRKLAANLPEVRSFTQDGGWIMLWGVTPEGLEDFNELVGADHLMRPFRQERASLRRPLDPLAIGISERDVAMTTGQKYMRFMNTEIPSKNAFTYAVDYDDIAPFCEYPPATYFKHEDEDPVNAGHAPINMVNGMTARDMWRFIFYIHIFDDPPTKWTCELPRRETIESFKIIPNTGYRPLEQMKLTFDGEDPVTLDFEPYEEVEPQHFRFEPRAAREVGMNITRWEQNDNRAVVGIDNIWLYVERSDEFYDRVHPMLTAGVLNRYPQGEGGILLNQVKLMESEVNPENVGKKKNIVKALLVNLDAAFGEELTVDRQTLDYTPLVFSDQPNLFLAKGKNWPTSPEDLSRLPTGKTAFRGVTYNVFENPLAPGDANVIGLGSYGDFEGVRMATVPVDRKADALFFLHTFLEEADTGADSSVLLTYVVHYADGKTAQVSVRYGREVANWLQRKPTDLPGAEVAWRAPAGGGRQTVLYQMQWANPRPGQTIESAEARITDAGDEHGMAVLIGLTAGRQQ